MDIEKLNKYKEVIKNQQEILRETYMKTVGVLEFIAKLEEDINESTGTDGESE